MVVGNKEAIIYLTARPWCDMSEVWTLLERTADKAVFLGVKWKEYSELEYVEVLSDDHFWGPERKLEHLVKSVCVCGGGMGSDFTIYRLVWDWVSIEWWWLSGLDLEVGTGTTRKYCKLQLEVLKIWPIFHVSLPLNRLQIIFWSFKADIIDPVGRETGDKEVKWKQQRMRPLRK